MSRSGDLFLQKEEKYGINPLNDRELAFPDYEEFLKKQEMTEEDINKMGEEYERERAF